MSYYAVPEADTSLATPVRTLYVEGPSADQPTKIADGLWWIRLPISGLIDHVNVYLLEDSRGWVLVDTGSNTERCRTHIERILASNEFSRLPLTQVLVTHYHPDHCGLAGWICETYNAPLVTTRTCWLNSRLLQMDRAPLPRAEHIHFMRRAGIVGLELESYQRRQPSDYWQLVSIPPYSYQRIKQNDELTIGARRWTVHIGNGHAAEHATLWSDDGMVILGDQVLPNISPNLSVHPSEPDADLLSEWIESCLRIRQLANNAMCCLPGHGLPFVGLQQRCTQLIHNRTIAVHRLLEQLSVPRTAVECLPAVYRRQLQSGERNTLLAETLGYLNFLHCQGVVRSELVAGTQRWTRVSRDIPAIDFEIAPETNRSANASVHPHP